MDFLDVFQDRACISEYVVNPHDVVQKLSESVIGQDDAKQVLAIASFQRGLRNLIKFSHIQTEHEPVKQNVLLIGDTGTGKTALIKALSEILDVPITRFDITSVTSAGYVGGKIEDLFKRHLMNCADYIRKREGVDAPAANQTPERTSYEQRLLMIAEHGIIYIDEFDKCRLSRTETNRGKDINGESVQQELLKVFEDGDIDLEKSILVTAKSIKTENILIICGGAFVGLNKIIASRKNKGSSIGFTSKLKETAKTEKATLKVTGEDLIEFGYLPELVGRISLTATLKSLTKENLKAILLLSKNSIMKQYETQFKMFKIDLEFTDKALNEIVKIAYSFKTGARALDHVVEKVLQEYQFNIFTIPEDTVLRITEEDVRRTHNATAGRW